MTTNFPQPTRPPFEMMILSGGMMIFFVLAFAYFMLRARRTAVVGDCIFWIGFGVFVQMLWTGLSPKHAELEEIRQRWIWVSWGLIAVGWCANFVKLPDKFHVFRWIQWPVYTLASALLGMALFDPSGSSVSRESARFVQCKINLQQIGMAIDQFHDRDQTLISPSDGEPPVSWRVLLLPYLDQQTIYDLYQFQTTWDSPENLAVAKSLVGSYLCPSYQPWPDDQGRYYTSYLLVVGPHSVWGQDDSKPRKPLQNESSRTAAVVEACGQHVVWTEPRDLDLDSAPIAINLPGQSPSESPASLSSYHPRGVHVLLADGSVQRIPIHMDRKVLRALFNSPEGEK